MTNSKSINQRKSRGEWELHALQNRYYNELLDEEERLELRDRILRLKNKLGRSQ